jgi:hypothetical protein
MPPERVALNMPEHLKKEKESKLLSSAILHWEMTCADDKPDNDWIANAI